MEDSISLACGQLLPPYPDLSTALIFTSDALWVRQQHTFPKHSSSLQPQDPLQSLHQLVDLTREVVDKLVVLVKKEQEEGEACVTPLPQQVVGAGVIVAVAIRVGPIVHQQAPSQPGNLSKVSQ
jgi:hypothetical protein